MMYKKECPVEGCDVVLHDDDMDRLIDHMKAHIKTHEEEDETKMKATADAVIEDAPGEDETIAKDDIYRIEEENEDEHFIPMDKLDEIVLTVTDSTPSHTPNIASALCEMQRADLGAITDSSNPFFDSKYADLSSVWGVIRKPLTDAGLSIMQYPEPFEGGITVVTRLYHVSGEMFETRLSGTTVLPPVKEKGVVVGEGKATVQGLGSLITYLRRYSISMLVGVAPKDDDDGNDASKTGSQKKKGGD